MAMTEFRRVQTHTTYRTEDGSIVPGTTGVVDLLARPALIHWAWKLGGAGIDYRKHRSQAAEVGTLVHLLVMCRFTGQEPDLSTFTPEQVEKARRAFGKFEDWARPKRFAPLWIEQPLVSERWRYGGTPDFVGNIDTEVTLADFKSGSGIFDEHVIQQAAYLQLIRELDPSLPIERVRIVRIGRDESEGFEERIFRPRDLAPYWRIFKHCLAIWWERRRLKGEGA